ncbi:MAG: MBL fold metallo-hydrolase, partial [Clostridium sp.]|nr:MBL fold metallo-hydrolase [Clostridium sp.]
GKKFYVVDNEILDKTGWFKESQVDKRLNSENEYFLDTDHSVVTGWRKISDQWFYFDLEGVMKKGWINDGGSIYYLDKSGDMLKGWNDIKGYKYYFEESGKRVTGKYYIDNKWYFFNSDGQLETGVYENNGKLYYSDEDGVMAFDSWIEKKRNKYYAKSDGSLAVGNLYLDGKTYNFDDDGSFNKIVDDEENLLYIEFLSVGDADCEFIKLPSGETVLIDTGDVSTTDKVVDFLKDQNLKTELFKRDDEVKEEIEEKIKADSEDVRDDKELESEEDDDKEEKTQSKSFNNGKGVIDYVILTHPHSDHIGGMIDILKNFNVGQVFVPKNFALIDFSGELDDSEKNKKDKEIMQIDYKVYNNTMKALKKNNVEVTEIVPESYIDSEKILQFKNSNRNFVAECTLDPYSKYASYNNNSAIVYLDYKDLQALFTADMEWNAEIDFVNRNALNGKEVDVLKAPHHGNDSSSSYIFMSYVKPDVAIVSRSKESIDKSIAQEINKTYPVCGVNKYETSTEDGVSLYSTKDNWTIVKETK